MKYSLKNPVDVPSESDSISSTNLVIIQGCNSIISMFTHTWPGGVQPVLDVEDLLILWASMSFFTDFVILRNLFLWTESRNRWKPFRKTSWRYEAADWLWAGLSDLILLSWDGAFSDELLSIFLQNSFLLLDLFVHQWLGEHRLIHLVVAITAITNLKERCHMPDWCHEL